ncbi:MAG: tetratricopeptide repeat-containing sensor histidine kinase [Bacteroidetes bacterium]|nr:tetratricopeptide repeat-containing sensor histidine kinase [Bacteroidota bacterium]
MRFYLLLIYFSITTSLFGQVDMLHFEQENALNEQLESLKNNPNLDTLERMSDRLEFLTLHSKIPLARLKYYLVESRKVTQNNPLLKTKEYRIYYISGVLDYLLGDTQSFEIKMADITKKLHAKADYKELAKMNSTLAGFYNFKSKFDLAKSIYLENEHLLTHQLNQDVQSRKVESCISNANNLALLYRNQGMLDSALYYYERSYERAKLYQHKAWIGIISGNIGYCHLAKGNYDLAEPLLITDVKYSLQQNQQTSAINAMTNLAQIELKRGQPLRAKEWLDKANQVVNQFDKATSKELDKPYYSLFKQLEGEIAIQLGNTDLGVKAFHEAIDSLNKINKAKSNANEEFLAKRYIIEKNLMVINSLEEQQTRKNLYLAIGVILVLSLAFFLWRQQVFNKNLKEKNLEIECQAKELEKLNLEKNRLLSIVSHDLRNPVANLNSLIEMQRDNDITQEEFIHFSKDISKSLKSLNSMLDNILHWAKASMDGGIVPELKLQSPADLIQQIIDQSKPLLDAKNQICEFINSNPSSWSFDSNLLSVVLRNLLHNAIKFSPTGSTIRIQTIQDGTRNLIQITDQGIGMDSYQLNKLLEGTVSKPGIGTSGERGTGLGMRISKEFLDAMSAKLQASSELGKGTQFDLVFPNQDK